MYLSTLPRPIPPSPPSQNSTPVDENNSARLFPLAVTPSRSFRICVFTIRQSLFRPLITLFSRCCCAVCCFFCYFLFVFFRPRSVIASDTRSCRFAIWIRLFNDISPPSFFESTIASTGPRRCPIAINHFFGTRQASTRRI